MTTANGRGPLNILAIANAWFDILAEQFAAVAAEQAAVEPKPAFLGSWVPAMAMPKLYRLADAPNRLIQPKNPCVVLTFNGEDVRQPGIMYNYRASLAYVAASPDAQPGGDNALFSCALAAEAIQRAIKIRPTGLNSINFNGNNISELMATADAVPLLSRIITVDLTFQVEEDF